MRIELFNTCSGKAKFEGKATLKNKRIKLDNAPKINIKNINDLFLTNSRYHYEFNFTLEKLFKERLNTQIKYNSIKNDNPDINPIISYARLNWFKRIQIKWQFNNCWIQDQNNIMWIINIIVAIIAIIFAAKSA